MTLTSAGRLSASIFLALLFYAHGQISHAASDQTEGHSADIGRPGSPSGDTRTIHVSIFDNSFELEAISVQAGETVRFVVENHGSLLHEFGIGTSSMHADHQAELKVMLKHGMIAADRIVRVTMDMDMGTGLMAHNDLNSVLVEPAQSSEIVWTFPTGGQLEFACNLPGHYQAGMRGTFEINR